MSSALKAIVTEESLLDQYLIKQQSSYYLANHDPEDSVKESNKTLCYA